MDVSYRVRKFRTSTEYKEWRKKIVERDKKCVICGSNKEIEVDHIKPLALYPELALKENNGRVLCKKCHKKTDTYGGFSRFKGEASIHPILSGDLLLKIKSLPTSIKFDGKEKGLTIKYIPDKKIWSAGYKNFKAISVVNEDVSNAIDKLFKKLRESSTYNRENELFLFKNREKIMAKQKATTEQRRKLYSYIESLLKRDLKDEEKQALGQLFREAIINYHEVISSGL